MAISDDKTKWREFVTSFPFERHVVDSALRPGVAFRNPAKTERRSYDYSVFLNRLQLGFYSVLARLDVAVDYRALEARLL